MSELENYDVIEGEQATVSNWSKLRVGDVIQSSPTPPLTKELVGAYADTARDHNPIHLDDEAAKQLGFPRSIAHGMLSMGWAYSLLAQWFDQALLVEQFGTRFIAPLFVGEHLTVEAKVQQIDIEDKRITLAYNGLNPQQETIIKGKICFRIL